MLSPIETYRNYTVQLIIHPIVAMDDLSSVEWTVPKAPTGQQRPQAPGNYYPALRPSPPPSGHATPSIIQPSQRPPMNGPPRNGSSTHANDSFANLVSFGSSQPSKNLSLQEQQRLREEAKQKDEAAKRKHLDARLSGVQAAAWDSLGDGMTTPNRITSPPTYTATEEYGGQRLSKIINKPFAGIPKDPVQAPVKGLWEDEDDLLAAFNAEAPVDKSSYMEPASKTASVDNLASFHVGIGRSGLSLNDMNGTSVGYTEDPDDDPFGLGIGGYVKAPKAAPVSNGTKEDDDVLGMLGRPVSEFPKKSGIEIKVPETPVDIEAHPQDYAVAELVDMGFAPDKAKRAMESTESGTDVQAAVGWLLNQAHEESRKKPRQPSRGEDHNGGSGGQQPRRTPGRKKSSTSGASKPAWMREQERPTSNQKRPDSKSPVNGEKDSAQYASEIGNKMFKTAGSLWKTGTKKFNQAVSEFNSDSDSNQPKWMRDAQAEPAARKPRTQQREHDVNDHDRMERPPRQRPEPKAQDSNITDEALMLEADSRPPPRKSRPKADAPRQDFDSSRDQSPALPTRPREQAMSQPEFMQQKPARDPRAKLSRQTVEEETAQAYISPARRKRPTPKPTPIEMQPEPEPDLLFTDSQPSDRPAQPAPRPQPSVQPRTPPATSLLTRPPPPKRNMPSLSSFAQQASTEARKAGNEAFKRGDYAQATTHYSTSLSALPSTHPLTIVILTNRSLSHSKTGDPKASIADAKAALELIGPSRGASETIDLGSGEGVKQMSIYWEKTMTRQAEALEHLERWSEAAAIWRACLEMGVGGSTSIAGRNRCEKAAAPPKPFTAPKKPVQRPRPKPSALGDFAPDSESVTRLRAANVAADRLDDEKFALADIVDSRVSKWRAGKEGNLRALLSTLENVLWEDSGWKQVGMADVLLPGKVKLIYMKGIAKVHPDKVC